MHVLALDTSYVMKKQFSSSSGLRARNILGKGPSVSALHSAPRMPSLCLGGWAKACTQAGRREAYSGASAGVPTSGRRSMSCLYFCSSHSRLVTLGPAALPACPLPGSDAPASRSDGRVRLLSPYVTCHHLVDAPLGLPQCNTRERWKKCLNARCSVVLGYFMHENC